MFGVGTPELVVIGIIALMVIGPERMPTVMGQIGRWYRQMRTMSNELLAEARQHWEEGMREVEDVSSTVKGAWQDATSDTPAPLPPPPLRQVPPALVQPATAAEAGPWVLAAAYSAPAPDVEPLGDVVATLDAPTMLPRTLPRPYDPALDDVIGAPTLMGPAATDDELAAMAYELPEEPAAPDMSEVLEPSQPSVAAGAPRADLAPVTTNGAGAHAAGEAESPEAIRERTIVDLYLKGGVTLEGAVRFLGVDADEFLGWVEFARSLERGSASQT